MTSARLQRDPNELRPHPLIQPMPRWAKDSDEWRAFVADIREHGVREPIKVVGDLVVDGETRRLAAKQLKLTVPTEEVPADEALAVIVRNLLLRRNVVSKSALAYLAYPLMQPAHEEATARHLARLKSGNRETISVSQGNGPRELAESIGVSRSLFDFAAKIHAAIAEEPAMKADIEESILLDGSYLGAVLAGIAGRKATKGDKKREKAGGAFTLFREAMQMARNRWRYWGKLDDDNRERAVVELRRTVADMPPDLRAEMKRAIGKVERDEKEHAA